MKKLLQEIDNSYIIAVLKTSREFLFYGILIDWFLGIEKSDVISMILVGLILILVYSIDIIIIKLSKNNKVEE